MNELMINSLKYYLKEFYIDKVPSKIVKELKDVSVEDNLIVYIPAIPDMIKAVVSTLLMKNFKKEKKEIKFYSTNMIKLVTESFKNGNEYFEDIKWIENIKYLVLTEWIDPEHKLYSEIIQNIVFNRMMKGLKTLIILTEKRADSFLTRDIISSFKEKNFKNKGISTSSVLSEGGRYF